MTKNLALLGLLVAFSSVGCGDTSGGRELAPDDAGAGGSGGGSVCPANGSGEVVVEITGLPSDVDADVVVEGPRTTDTVTAGTTLSMVDAGSYTVTAARVFDADPIVRTVYDPTLDEPEFCLAEDGTQTVTVTYEAIATSNKLWTDNANAPASGGPLLAFASADLAESGAPTWRRRSPCPV